jgi:hypothetical protein
VVVIDGSPTAASSPPPEVVVFSDKVGQDVPPRKESARSDGEDARALVKAKGPAQEPQGHSQPLVSLHVSPAAMLLDVVSAPDSSLGLAGTMEKVWRNADMHELTSQDKSKGMASMECSSPTFAPSLTPPLLKPTTALGGLRRLTR